MFRHAKNSECPPSECPLETVCPKKNGPPTGLLSLLAFNSVYFFVLAETILQQLPETGSMRVLRTWKP